MNTTDRPLASSTREEKQAELQERIAQCRFKINAHVELARLIDSSSATCQGYQAIWSAVSDRLREDARIIEKERRRAEERLADITLASEAAARYVRNVPTQQQHPVRPTRVLETDD